MSLDYKTNNFETIAFCATNGAKLCNKYFTKSNKFRGKSHPKRQQMSLMLINTTLIHATLDDI
jgi:hypothetical protein